MSQTEKRDVSQSDGSATDRESPPVQIQTEQPAEQPTHAKWTWGILADKQTSEVPGTVLLLSKYSISNVPLGLHHEGQRGRSSTRNSISAESDRRRSLSQKKTTPDGQVILDPQPDDSLNDPLNWPKWRRDAALFSLGFYCMVGGGMTPVLAAGFNQVARDLSATFAEVARTTGLYMMGLAVGCVLFSPTAILYGKRPVYLCSSLLFIGSSLWCALAPDYGNLAVARVLQGIGVSPVECLPSATIAEIFFLHERAFRIGIYSLLLLGGKNLAPLVSAVIIQTLGWRWVFHIVAMVVAFGAFLLFLFVPETFWDRTPRPRALSRRHTTLRMRSTSFVRAHREPSESAVRRHAAFKPAKISKNAENEAQSITAHGSPDPEKNGQQANGYKQQTTSSLSIPTSKTHPPVRFAEDDPTLPPLHNLNSPYYTDLEKSGDDYLTFGSKKAAETERNKPNDGTVASLQSQPTDPSNLPHRPPVLRQASHMSYTPRKQAGPVEAWSSTLRPWNGRLDKKTKWWRAAIRPAILLAYPAITWSSLVYSMSVGWLIVISEAISHIYSTSESYNFSSLQIGLVYISPFIGAIFGSAVAGRLSDVIVRFMARRNDGIYEPEYRLVMAVPITISTVVGLMGFGWSAEEKDAWYVPTIFFGIISFGCALGTTTSITFAVDSYRQYAGEALVTLNFCKNVFHGLIFSLFFPQWLEADGSKHVFIAIGGIQLASMLFTIPMYVFGKRARMWTVRKSMMDRF